MSRIYIEERAIKLAEYIIDNKDTVRGAAKKFGISKSTVHKDVSSRLLRINKVLAVQVREILNENNQKTTNYIYLHFYGSSLCNHDCECNL